MTAPATPTQPEDFPETGPDALASFGQRVIARLIDLIIVTLPVALVAIRYVTVDDDRVSFEQLPTWVLPLQVSVAVAYETVMLSLWGRTVGKWIVGVRVASYAHRTKPAPTQAAQRTLLPNVFAAVPVPFVSALQWVVYGSSSFNPLRRGWHDRYAGTIVLRSR
jgi:uncharacterized RDD family membrane protein YckC